MSIKLVSAYIMVNGECDESMFSIEVKESKVEILNASGEFNAFDETKKALEEAVKTINLLEGLEK